MRRPGSFRAALAAVSHRIAGVRVPVHVQWVLTDRGPRLPWSYAHAPPRTEMTTHEVEEALESFVHVGTTELVYTGGDPLLRDDIGPLTHMAVDRGVRATVETPGERYHQRVDELHPETRLVFHVEGGRDTHDHLRGNGSYDEVVLAMEAAAGRGQPFGISMTITRYNADEIDTVLTLAESLGTKLRLRTVGIPPAFSRDEAEATTPLPEAHRAAWSQALSALDAGRPVATSRRAIVHLLGWGDLADPLRAIPGPVPCLAGRLYCSVDVDGTVVPCSLLLERGAGLDVREAGAIQAFWYAAPPPCRSCTATGLFDENALLGLQAPALLHASATGR